MSLTHITETIPTVVALANTPCQGFKPADAALMDFEEVQALSPAEQVLWLEARNLHQAKQHQAEQEAKREQKSFRCPYCLDQNFIFLLPVWLEFKYLPREFSEETIAFVQHLKTGNIAFPCECHPHKPEAFYSRFGHQLKGSNYGAALIQFRRMIAKRRKQETQA